MGHQARSYVPLSLSAAAPDGPRNSRVRALAANAGMRVATAAASHDDKNGTMGLPPAVDGTVRRITVLGTGYLGTVHAAWLAETGFDVLGMEADSGEGGGLGRGGPPCRRRRRPPPGVAPPTSRDPSRCCAPA